MKENEEEKKTYYTNPRASFPINFQTDLEQINLKTLSLINFVKYFGLHDLYTI